MLDGSLRAIGREADPIRSELRAYLAAVIFSTWPDEPAPSGDFPRGLAPGQAESTELTVLLRHVEEQVQELHATTPIQARLIAALPQQFDAFSNARWAVIETEDSDYTDCFLRPDAVLDRADVCRLWTVCATQCGGGGDGTDMRCLACLGDLRDPGAGRYDRGR